MCGHRGEHKSTELTFVSSVTNPQRLPGTVTNLFVSAKRNKLSHSQQIYTANVDSTVAARLASLGTIDLEAAALRFAAAAA